MVRQSPCQYCHQRRRKCERNDESESCQRCIKMNRKCMDRDSSTDTSSEDDSELQDSVEMVLLYEQVVELDRQIRSLEAEKQALVRQEPQWLIEFVDGQFRLKSKIQSLEEMMLFTQSAIRYLSPFGNTFLKQPLHFERVNPSMLRSTLRTLWSSFSQRRPYRAIEANNIQPITVMPRLIDRYFTCYNDGLPILYESSYRSYLAQLQDPLSDPVTLAICASTAISTCKHSFLDSYEKRYLGEYYYDLCMEHLTEMFDDPDRTLETLLTINILQSFMFYTLRITQAKKWASIALILAKNLRTEYKDCHLGTDLDMPTRIQFAIIHRNCSVAMHLLSFIDLTIHNRQELEDVFRYPFDILPGDSKQSREWIELTNCIIQLCSMPAFDVILKESRRLLVGHQASLSFEEIMQFEPIVLSWWHQLPAYARLCQNPFEMTKENIQQTTHTFPLMLACTLHVITLSMQGAFVQPIASQENENLNAIVTNKAISSVLHSATMCFYLTRQIELSESTCYALSRVIICIIDGLLAIMKMTDRNTAHLIKQQLQECLSELGYYFSADHLVSPLVSPLTDLTPTSSERPSADELYGNYPIPGEAMLYDVMRTLVDKHIG